MQVKHVKEQRNIDLEANFIIFFTLQLFLCCWLIALMKNHGTIGVFLELKPLFFS